MARPLNDKVCSVQTALRRTCASSELIATMQRRNGYRHDGVSVVAFVRAKVSSGFQHCGTTITADRYPHTTTQLLGFSAQGHSAGKQRASEPVLTPGCAGREKPRYDSHQLATRGIRQVSVSTLVDGNSGRFEQLVPVGDGCVARRNTGGRSDAGNRFCWRGPCGKVHSRVLRTSA